MCCSLKTDALRPAHADSYSSTHHDVRSVSSNIHVSFWNPSCLWLLFAYGTSPPGRQVLVVPAVKNSRRYCSRKAHNAILWLFSSVPGHADNGVQGPFS